MIITSYSIVIVIMVVNNLISNVNAISPDCECITYVDTFGKEHGVFTSPNWPTPYEENIKCLLYHFMGKPNQIIEINFDEFDVQKSNIA